VLISISQREGQGDASGKLEKNTSRPDIQHITWQKGERLVAGEGEEKEEIRAPYNLGGKIRSLLIRRLPQKKEDPGEERKTRTIRKRKSHN